MIPALVSAVVILVKESMSGMVVQIEQRGVTSCRVPKEGFGKPAQTSSKLGQNQTDTCPNCNRRMPH
jgi:hypothetical protein